MILFPSPIANNVSTAAESNATILSGGFSMTISFPMLSVIKNGNFAAGMGSDSVGGGADRSFNDVVCDYDWRLRWNR